MNTKLKLHRDTDDVGEPRPLRFPVEAVACFPARRCGTTGEPAHRPVYGFKPTTDIVRGVENTLDRLQRGLNDLKGQIHDNSRLAFPTPAARSNGPDRHPDPDRPAAA